MHNNGIVVFGEDTDFGKPKKDLSGGATPTTLNDKSSEVIEEDNSDYDEYDGEFSIEPPQNTNGSSEDYDDYYDEDDFNIEPLAPQQVVASDEDLAMFEASIPLAVRRPVNINYADLIAQSEQVYATNSVISSEDVVFNNTNTNDKDTDNLEESSEDDSLEVEVEIEVEDNDDSLEVGVEIELEEATEEAIEIEEPQVSSNQSELVYDSEDSLYNETKYKSDNIIRDYEEDNAYHYPLIYLSGEGVEQYRIQALGGMLDNRSFIDTDEILYNVYIELPDGVIFVGKLLSRNLRILLNNRTFDVFDKKVYLDEDTKYEGDMLYALSEISPTILD